MIDDPYLQCIAILIQNGFQLNDIWSNLPWEGDMPEDVMYAFAMIYRKMEDEKLQKLTRV